MNITQQLKSIDRQDVPVYLAAILYVLLSVLETSSAVALDVPRSTSLSTKLTVQIGPVEVIRGPDTVTDNPFHTLMGATSLQGYVANSSTWGYTGGSLETLRPMSDIVLQAGTGFDSCGAWLNSVWQDGAVIRGWYHAETECAYPQTHKSVAYVESYDGGRTFVKVNYPNNQVVTAPPAYTDPDLDDEGDHQVIRVGDYLYMYFIASRDWQVRVARSHVSQGGRPGTWYKYHNGSFSEPGIGGESSPIDPSGALTRSWVSYNSYLGSYLGFSYIQRDGKFAGYGFTVSPDGISSWTTLPYLVLSSEGEYWGRNPDSKDLAEYLSLISVYGDGTQIGDTFWLYYMYLNPGEDFDRRYLARRKIHIGRTTSNTPSDLVPHIALSEYQNLDDTWFTTTSTALEYQLVDTIGYLFTDEVPNSVPVYDCYIDFWHDHMLVPNDNTCGCGDVHYLRRAGWISTVPFDNSIQVYRCWDEAATNHFISTDPNCEGKTTEWPMGYLATIPSLPENQFVALSNYYWQDQQDNWVTTTKPPQEYAFQARLGYLFADSKPNSVPVYDCYIDFWADHMLVPSDGSCDGAQPLGLMGYISSAPFEGSVPIYRCFDEQATNHFVSFDPGCSGKRFEWLVGYVASQPYTVKSRVYLPIVLRR